MHPQAIMPRVCVQCGAQLPAAYRNRPDRRHCSRACANISKRVPQKPLADRLWAKVNRDGPIPTHRPELGPCWVWTGGLQSQGYGMIGASAPRRSLLTHRVSYELHYGPIPDGLFVLHHCDNPPCLRPAHLFLGDDAANRQDAANKGRLSAQLRPEHVQGSRNGFARLTEDRVREIHRLASTMTASAIAIQMGVSVSTISLILRGQRWQHVKPE